MHFIGIDLSWKISPPKPNRTAAIVLDEDYDVRGQALLTTDEDILDFVKPYLEEGCVVGIDAPLVVPPNQKQRQCEHMLLSCGIGVFPGKRAWFEKAFGGVRGEFLVEELDRIGIPLRDFMKRRERESTLFEVYPYASWKVVFGEEKVPKYKNTNLQRKVEGLKILRNKLLSLNPPLKMKSENKKEHGLDANVEAMSGKELDLFGDILDAAMASYTVLLYWHFGKERCVVLGNAKEGFILTLANKRLREIAHSPHL